MSKLTNTWIAVGVIAAVSIGATGCNFFGREEPKTTTTSSDSLPGDFIATWSYIETSTATNNTPDSVFYTRYRLNSNNRVEFEYTDMLSGGVSVDVRGPMAYSSSQDILLFSFTEGTDPTNSFLGYGLAFYRVLIEDPDVLLYSFSQTGSTRILFRGEESEAALPVGVWKFDGEFGIDFAVISKSGYGVVQTRDTEDNPVLLDMKTILTSSGELVMQFFTASPSDVTGEIIFDRFAETPNGLELEAEGTTQTGTKL